MEITNYDPKYWKEPCPKIPCKKKPCCCGLAYVFMPASIGSGSLPEKGAFSNAIVEYEDTGAIYVYSAEGIPVQVTSSDPGELEKEIEAVAQRLANETAARTSADARLTQDLASKQEEITQGNKLDADLVDDATSVNKFATAEDLSKIGTAVQPNDIDYTVMSDLDVDSNPSTSLVRLDAAKVNLKTGAATSKTVPLPVVSTTQAGVMNSATFDAVSSNTANINALLNGAVAVSGLPASPTQAELTTAWQSETGLTTLINRAQILDSTNSKLWTYYVNDSVWYEAPVGGTISINTFTNLSEGVIKGSTNVGQVFAENDGTGSVNGWDSLSAQVTDNTNNMVRVGSVLSQPNTVAYVGTDNIINGAVTASKIDVSSLIDVFYPVGSYYETSDTTFDPNVSWGGTWAEDSDGRVTVAMDNGTFATVGNTGGEETHTLTVAEMPKHSHNLGYGTNLGSGSDSNPNYSTTKRSNQTGQAGGDGAHNNLQPYIVVKRWHRTA